MNATLTLPAKERTPRPTAKRRHVLVRAAHASMQFSDPRPQVAADANVLLGRGYRFFTGTEADGKTSHVGPEFRRAAREHGYRLALRSEFVAVNRAYIVPGTFRAGFVPVIPSSGHFNDPHKHTERGIVFAEYVDNELQSPVAVAAFHMLTKGRWHTQSFEDNRACPVSHRSLNIDLARALGRFTRNRTKRGFTVFVNGDANMIDRRDDVFFGAPLTTCWDELKKWPDTGHGNIDVIASADANKSVKCVSARALPDRRLHLHTDHYLIEANYRVTL